MVSLFIEFCKQLVPTGDKGQNRPLLCGHNVIFDIAFVKYAFKFCNKDLADYVISNNGEIGNIDTLLLAKRRWANEKGHRLEDCLKRIGVKINDAHRAMNDVVATVKLLSYFMGHLVGQATVKSVKKEENKESKNPNEESIEVDNMRKSFEF
jgi:DNA polymerase III epsilon subunit-like protein